MQEKIAIIALLLVKISLKLTKEPWLEDSESDSQFSDPTAYSALAFTDFGIIHAAITPQTIIRPPVAKKQPLKPKAVKKS
jgi:hypothetical protein